MREKFSVYKFRYAFVLLLQTGWDCRFDCGASAPIILIEVSERERLQKLAKLVLCHYFFLMQKKRETSKISSSEAKRTPRYESRWKTMINWKFALTLHLILNKV